MNKDWNLVDPDSLTELRTFTPEYLQHIAKITAHMRDVAENLSPTEAVLKIHGLSLMLDGILIAAGLDVNFPDYEFEKMLNEPEVEVKGNPITSASLDVKAMEEELRELHGFSDLDIDVVSAAYGLCIMDILDEVNNFDSTSQVQTWVKNAYAVASPYAEAHSGIPVSREDSKEIENILRKQ